MPVCELRETAYKEVPSSVAGPRPPARQRRCPPFSALSRRCRPHVPLRLQVPTSPSHCCGWGCGEAFPFRKHPSFSPGYLVREGVPGPRAAMTWLSPAVTEGAGSRTLGRPARLCTPPHAGFGGWRAVGRPLGWGPREEAVRAPFCTSDVRGPCCRRFW